MYKSFIKNKQIEGNSKKEFILNYLSALYEETKDLDAFDRLEQYIKHFTENFSYDKTLYKTRTGESYEDSFENNENALFTFLTEKKGVCAQLAASLSLTTIIDSIKSGADAYFEYTTCLFRQPDNSEVGHAINTKTLKNGITLVIDMSSMLHAQEGQYKQTPDNFKFKTMEEYTDNIEKENAKILPVANNCITTYTYNKNIGLDKYYQLINESYDTLLEKHTRDLRPTRLPDDIESHI